MTWPCIFVDKQIEGITWAQASGKKKTKYGIDNSKNTVKSVKNENDDNFFFLISEKQGK